MTGSDYAYCKNAWNVLDGFIVLASLISILFKSMLGDIGWASTCAHDVYHCHDVYQLNPHTDTAPPARTAHVINFCALRRCHDVQ